MVLTEDNFLQCAMRAYDNLQCHTLSEFESDLKKIQLVKRMLSRYNKTSIISEQLILNHIIILFNVFGDLTVKMLFFKLDKEFWPTLIPFLIFLNRMPDFIPEYGFILSEVEVDRRISITLSKL